MSGLISAIRLRLGLSNTPANNFVLRALDDGLLRISRGNPLAETTDVLTVGADNVLSAAVSPPAGDNSFRLATTAFLVASALGLGQTWQAVTRSAGVTYTNTTGRPIVLLLNLNAAGAANVGATISINGGASITFINGGAGTGPVNAAGAIIIPVGATYVFTLINVTSFNAWELR